MSEIKRLQQQLEQLEKTYKLGIIGDSEYNKGKENIEKKLAPLLKEHKKKEDSKKIIKEIIEEPKETNKAESAKEKSAEKSAKVVVVPIKPSKDKKEEVKPEVKENKTEKKEEALEEKKKEEKKETKKEDRKEEQKKKEKSKAETPKKAAAKEKKEKEEGGSWFGSYLFIAAFVIIILIAFLLMFGNSADRTPVTAKNLTGIDTRVTIEIYSSYNCRACANLFYTMQDIKTMYGDNVEINYMHFPLSPQEDVKLDIASMCAKKQNKSNEMSQELYDARKPISSEKLLRIAGDLGMDKAAFDECLQSRENLEMMVEEYRQAIAKGIEQVPSVYIDGSLAVGSKPVGFYEAIIDSIIIPEPVMPVTMVGPIDQSPTNQTAEA